MRLQTDSLAGDCERVVSLFEGLKKLRPPSAHEYSLVVTTLAQKLHCTYFLLASNVRRDRCGSLQKAIAAMKYWNEMILYHVPESETIVEFVLFLRKQYLKLDNPRQREEIVTTLRVRHWNHNYCCYFQRQHVTYCYMRILIVVIADIVIVREARRSAGSNGPGHHLGLYHPL
jgi:hypothetical protein